MVAIPLSEGCVFVQGSQVSSRIESKAKKDFPFYPAVWNAELAAAVAANLESLGALLHSLPDGEYFEPVSSYEIRPELRITPDL